LPFWQILANCRDKNYHFPLGCFQEKATTVNRLKIVEKKSIGKTLHFVDNGIIAEIDVRVEFKT